MGESVSFSIFLKDYFSKSLVGVEKTSDKVFDKLDKNLDEVDKKARNTGKGLSTGLGGAFNGIGKMAASLGATLGLGAAIVGAGKLGVQAEQTSVAFTTMTGSAEVAQKTIKDLSDFSAKTPYGKREVLDAGKQMLAYGFTADEIKGRLTALGDVASGLGQPLGEMTYLFGTIKTQGKAMTADLNQFANRGVPIFEEVAKVMGIGKDQVKDYASEGKISYAVIEQAFTNMSKEGGKFFNMMDSQSQTAGGRLSTMFDNLEFLGEKLGLAMLPLINSFVDLGSVLLEKLQPAVNIISPAFEWLGNHFKDILTFLGPLAAVIAAYKMWAIVTNIVTIAQIAFNAALTANPVGLVIAAIALLIGGLILAYQKSETFRGIVLGLWEVLKQLWDVVVVVAKAIWDFSPPFVMIRAQIQALVAVVQWMWPIIKDVFGKVKTWIVDTFGDAFKWVVDKVKSLFEWLLSIADKMGLSDQVKKIRDAFNTGFEKGKDKEEEKQTEEGAVNALGKSTTINAIGSNAKAGKEKTKGLDNVTGASKAAKSITINMEKFVDTFNINTTNLKEGTSEIKRQILEAFSDAVRDFETSYN